MTVSNPLININRVMVGFYGKDREQIKIYIDLNL